MANPEGTRASRVLRGDAVGDTLYSERWILRQLMNLTKYVSGELKFTSDIESELCIFWDMCAEKDVIRFTMKHGILSLVVNTIMKSTTPRLSEIMVGILGNLCSLRTAREECKRRSDVVKVVIDLLAFPDSPTLIQVMRVLNTFAWEVTNSGMQSPRTRGSEDGDKIQNDHDDGQQEYEPEFAPMHVLDSDDSQDEEEAEGNNDMVQDVVEISNDMSEESSLSDNLGEDPKDITPCNKDTNVTKQENASTIDARSKNKKRVAENDIDISKGARPKKRSHVTTEESTDRETIESSVKEKRQKDETGDEIEGDTTLTPPTWIGKKEVADSCETESGASTEEPGPSHTKTDVESMTVDRKEYHEVDDGSLNVLRLFSVPCVTDEMKSVANEPVAGTSNEEPGPSGNIPSTSGTSTDWDDYCGIGEGDCEGEDVEIDDDDDDDDDDDTDNDDTDDDNDENDADNDTDEDEENPEVVEVAHGSGTTISSTVMLWYEQFLNVDTWLPEIMYILNSSKNAELIENTWSLLSVLCYLRVGDQYLCCTISGPDLLRSLLESYKEYFRQFADLVNYDIHDISKCRKGICVWTTIMYSFTFHGDCENICSLYKADIMKRILQMLRFFTHFLPLDGELHEYLIHTFTILEHILRIEPYELPNLRSGVNGVIRFLDELTEEREKNEAHNIYHHYEDDTIEVTERYLTNVLIWLNRLYNANRLGDFDDIRTTLQAKLA